ncbi:MAG: chorismate synthase [Fidelibacterota bacterium]|nr:MAG: chorismate synthase [Candidatus Neomarinimicrobiota bacterium]
MRKLRWLTAGESHGKGLVGVLEGLPAGLEITEDYIASQLARRQKGHGRGQRMDIESDRAEIYSGIRHGSSLGSPIALIIPNRDWANWQQVMSVGPVEDGIEPVTLPRPGHGDLAGARKYGFTDIRNVLERASARETAMRVALGSIARKFLGDLDIEVGSRVLAIHDARDESALPDGLSPEGLNALVDGSPVRCLDKKAEKAMIRAIDDAQGVGDSVGGIFEVIATGIPYGLGSHTQWDLKLKARLGEAIVSINAIEGMEIGLGFVGVERPGSTFHDEIIKEDDPERLTRSTNNAGGIEAGMSNAQPVIIRAVMKPIPTLAKPLKSVDIQTGEPGQAHKERTDACAVPAAAVVAESMVCLVLADALLEKFGGDSMKQVKAHMHATARY